MSHAQQAQQQKKTTPCKYHVLYGNCRYGDACHFFHPPALVKEQQPVAARMQQKINGPLASKRTIRTAGDSKITITSSANEPIIGKRKRILAPDKGGLTLGKQTQGQTRQQPQQKKIKNTNKIEEDSGALPSMARTTTLKKPATRRTIRNPPSDSSTSPDSSPISSSAVSPLCSPPSSPARSLPQLIQPTLNGFSVMVAEKKAREEHSHLYGGYSWDKSGAGRASAQQQDYTLNLLAEGTWDLHEDSIVAPSAFAVAFGSFALPKRKRISLGGSFKFLPATEEDKQKNVYWIEMTKTKESVQEEGGLVSEKTTTPATLRVPYQISTTQPQKVGILMNAFGKEQILLVKSL